MAAPTAALLPEHKEILGVLGHFFLEHGQTDKALILLEALGELFPHDAALARPLSYAYLQAGRYQDALEAATRAGGQEDGFLQLLRGKALWGLGQAAEARASLERYRQTRATP